jgi:uncharacterized membrane protein
MFPASVGVGARRLNIEQPETTLPENFDDQSVVVRAAESGYIAYIDANALFALAVEHDVMLELIHRPGFFVTAGAALGRAYPLERASESLEDAFRDAIILGDRRTHYQDVELLIDQIASIGVRAISPAVNDPFTATMCLDRLVEGMCSLGKRDIPSAYRYDDARRLRLITNPVTFEGVFYRAFDELRHYGAGDLKIALHLLGAIQVIGECVREENRAVLIAYAEMVWSEAHDKLTHEHDRRRLDAGYRDTKRALRVRRDLA